MSKAFRAQISTALAVMSGLFVVSPTQAAPAALARTTFTRSAGPLPAAIATTARPLSPANLAEKMHLGVRLALRNQAELERRVEAGELLSTAELQERYLPLASDYNAVIGWLKSEGFTVTHSDDTHMGVFFTGSAAQVQRSFATTLVRVTVEGADYSTPNTAPSLPASISAPVLGVIGLHPYVKLKPHHTGVRPVAFSPTTASKVSPTLVKPNDSGYPSTYFIPSQILAAFNGSSISQLGTGQRIAILADSTPGTYNSGSSGAATPNSNLTTFWTQVVGNHTGGYEQFTLSSNPFPTTPAGVEVTLDSEWTSGMAPAATIRVYAAGDVDGNGSIESPYVENCLEQMITDIKAGISIQQLSISYGGPESPDDSSDDMTDDTSYFLVLASKGVSIFVSTGDYGSNPSGGTTSQAEFYSTSPHVTAVGGTSLEVNADGTREAETVWNDYSSNPNTSYGATGGGASIIFPKPVWQTGTGVPAASHRYVPDVALPADPETAAIIYATIDGTTGYYTVGGTSWSTPTWAGFCARINQSRTAAGRGTLGLLTPRLYPLLSSTVVSNFYDITTGNNFYGTGSTTYSAGVGYDECTGLGTPNMGNLLGTLTGPAITNFSPSSGSVGGSIILTGTNLNLVSSVTFNGASAAFTVNSATQITATVPGGATTGAITVSNPVLATGTAGDTFTTTTNFTVTAPDLKVVSTHSGSFTAGDNGDTYTLTVSNVGNLATTAGNTVTLTDSLPTADAYIVSASGQGWTCTVSGPVSGGTRTATCTRSDSLAPNASYAAVTLVVNVNPSGNTAFNNHVTVSVAGDTDSGNDVYNDATIVNSATDTPTLDWRYLYFGTTANSGNAADTANPSGDGLPNLVKYALGLDPTMPAVSTVTYDTTQGYFRVTVPKNPNATDVTFTVQATDDLTNPASWGTSGTMVVSAANANPLVVGDSRSYPPTDGTVKRFFRLLISR